MRVVRLAVSAAAVMVVAAGCDAAPKDAESKTPESVAPSEVGSDCPDPGVVIAELGSDAATGFRAMTVQMTNCRSGDYEVTGYPVVRVLDAEQQSADIEITHGANSIPDPGATLLTLAPGESATMVLSWRNTVEAGDPVDGVALEVAPADGEPTQTFETEYPVDLGTTGTLDVTAWQPAEATS